MTTRQPKRCSNCNCEGHQIRTCNDPALQETRKTFFKKIQIREPIESIMEYAKSNPLEKIRLITYKTEKGKVSKISSLTEKEPAYYENLEKYIKKEYEKQEDALKKKLILKIMLIQHRYQVPQVSITPMYHSYITLLTSDPNRIAEVHRLISQEGYPSEEIRLLNDVNETTTRENMIEPDTESLNMFTTTNSFNPELYRVYPTYEMMTRWIGFLLVIESEYRARTRIKPQVLLTIEYNFIKRLQTETETIDCPICMENITTPEISEVNCGHKFCRSCIRQTINRHARDKRCGCPMCRNPIEKIVRKYIKTD